MVAIGLDCHVAQGVSYEASEREKVNAGKQVWAVAAKLKPNAAAEIRQAFRRMRGGCDSAANMQWQTIEEAKAKDKVE